MTSRGRVLIGPWCAENVAPASAAAWCASVFALHLLAGQWFSAPMLRWVILRQRRGQQRDLGRLISDSGPSGLTLASFVALAP